MEYPVLTPDQRAAYDRDGFVLVRGLFDAEEALLLQKAMETDPRVRGEVYHYHSKLTAKDPFEGGAWEWHQDYGYWYNNGCLSPGCLRIRRPCVDAQPLRHTIAVGAIGLEKGPDLAHLDIAGHGAHGGNNIVDQQLTLPLKCESRNRAYKFAVFG